MHRNQAKLLNMKYIYTSKDEQFLSTLNNYMYNVQCTLCTSNLKCWVFLNGQEFSFYASSFFVWKGFSKILEAIKLFWTGCTLCSVIRFRTKKLTCTFNSISKIFYSQNMQWKLQAKIKRTEEKLKKKKKRKMVKFRCWVSVPTEYV